MTGVHVVDAFISGSPLTTVGVFTLYPTTSPVHAVSSGLAPLSSLDSYMCETTSIDHRAKYIILQYVGGAFSYLQVYEELIKRLSAKTIKCAIICGDVEPGKVLVFIRKLDYKGLPPFDIPGLVRTMYGMHRGDVKFHEKFIIQLDRCYTRAVRNFQLKVNEPGKLTFEGLLESCQRLTDQDLEVLLGELMMKPKRSRTAEETAIMDAMPQLKRVRTLRSSPGRAAMLWDATCPPHDVVPVRFLLNLDQKATRLLEQTNTVEEKTLHELMRDPALLAQHGLVILGPDGSTGFGKTSFAKRLACEWSKLQVSMLGLPAHMAKVCWATSIDDLREVSLREGQAVVVDEFEVRDTNAIQFASAGMLKTLVDPTNSANVRCRNRNAFIPAGTARIFTANADSAELWTQPRFRWTAPLARKAYVVVVSRPLVLPNWSKHPDFARRA
jgi:hypothetical protein